MKSKIALLVVGVAAGLAVAGAGLGWFARPYTFHGSYIEQAVAAPDFTLTDQHGQPFQLSAQKGSVVLFFFGYSNCPDECPATLSRLAAIRRQLGSQAEHVRVALVTVDPETDTPARLGEYLAQFDAPFVGLTGTADDLLQVWTNYGVYVEKLLGGAVDHTLRLYAVDARGDLRLTYASDVLPDEMAQDVRELLKLR